MFKKIVSPIVLWILRTSARMQIAKYNPKIIGVAGSSGKTSLVSLLAGVLSEKYTVLATSGQNSETGLPLRILGLGIEENSLFDWVRILFSIPFKLLFDWKRYEVFVAEMGIDSPVEPKNMSYLLKIIQPSVGVVTNVSLEHSMYFEPFVKEIDPVEKERAILRLTAEQELMLLTALEKDEIAIVNLDDSNITETRKQIEAKKITVSLSENADLLGKNITTDLSSFSMTITYLAREYQLIINQPLPNHFAYEFLLTLAAGLAMDLSLDEAIASLQKHFSLPPGRLGFFEGIDNTVIIDSTYNNATLPPVLDILDFVKTISGKRRKVAILGDMRELGEEAQHAHEQVAQKILETVDFAIIIGPLSEQYIVPILEKAQFPFENFPDVTSSKKAIVGLVAENDVILVKGSQNTIFLEKIVEMLLADKNDVKKLTRRGAFWDKKRSESL